MLSFACGGSQASTSGSDPLSTTPTADLVQAGLYLEQRGDYVRAEQYLTAALERGHSESEIVPHLVSVSVQSSRLTTALSYGEPYLERHPEDLGLRMLMGSIAASLGQNAKAERHFLQVVERSPNEPLSYYFLAVLAREAGSGNADRVRHYFARYVELAPEGEHVDEARDYLNRRHDQDRETAGEPMPSANPSGPSANPSGPSANPSGPSANPSGNIRPIPQPLTEP